MRKSLCSCLLSRSVDCALAASTSSAPAGQGCRCRGRAEAIHKGLPQPLRILQRLLEADEIRLPHGANARLVYFADNHWEELRGPCRVQVTARQGRLLSGKPGSLVRRSSVSEPLNAPEGNLDRLGGTKFRRVLDTVRSTMKHAVIGVPRFTWESAVPGPFEVKVHPLGSTQDADLIWTGQTEARELLYGGPTLQEDLVHTWSVAPLSVKCPVTRARWTRCRPLRSCRPGPAEVHAGEQGGQALRDANPEDPRSTSCCSISTLTYNMLEEAVAAGLRASALRPRDVGLHQALLKLYQEMGDGTKAAQEEELVRKLECEEKGQK